ncbi:MAG: hypothetical protein M3314_00720 [Actinomycetota bacterium]|jgi:t-SNARE complex subunit (syntaxin)|nr:hypothetical protein [Actinomycetota bacterium]
MTDPQLEDHLVGLELQLVELVESQQRAEVQGRTEDVARLDKEIAELQEELARTAEVISEAEEQSNVFPTARLSAPTAAERAAAA